MIVKSLPTANTVFLFCVGLNSLLGLLVIGKKSRTVARSIWGCCLVCWCVQLGACFAATGLHNLSGIGINYGIAALVLILWQWWALREDTAVETARINAFFLICLALLSLIQEESRGATFIMDYLFVKLFFLSRPIALGLILYALSGAILGHRAACMQEKSLPMKTAYRAQRATFLAGLIFLGGEIAGCYWGFLGWGTTWRWSGNFFFSAMIFVFLMATVHLTRTFDLSSKAGPWRFSLPLAAVALSMTLAKVWQ